MDNFANRDVGFSFPIILIFRNILSDLISAHYLFDDRIQEEKNGETAPVSFKEKFIRLNYEDVKKFIKEIKDNCSSGNLSEEEKNQYLEKLEIGYPEIYQAQESGLKNYKRITISDMIKSIQKIEPQLGKSFDNNYSFLSKLSHFNKLSLIINGIHKYNFLIKRFNDCTVIIIASYISIFKRTNYTHLGTRATEIIEGSYL